ncbi:alpha/beta hydrolase [Solilutibacter silvestris]|uniref:Alpha/beta hydrolase n=1 Tax=Solilutibacter silvestris TaxID=1645665 RepID=A0A2K1Q3F7_9GAMM|nr:alpha/beta hydrolase [Lysobacter silvestris]PNS09568.1 Alpha/beta hydrolase [Lysobacter silvestris]
MNALFTTTVSALHPGANLVTFPHERHALAGQLTLPADWHAGQRPPAIIVMGSWTTVKEQMAANYAPMLAAAGFAALSFDFSGYGESGGEPREVESAQRKIGDIGAALDYLAALNAIDGERIGVLAICASAGYLAMAADELAIRSIAMVAPWLHDRELVEAIYGGREAVAAKIAQGEAARVSFEQTGTVDYIPAASNSDPGAAMYAPGDALDYYLNPRRGRIPQWGGRFAVMAWSEWLQLDTIAAAARVRAPTRIITGPDTATPGGAARFAAALPAPHDTVSLPGTQFDFYDNPATVAAAAAAAVEHFRRTL